MDCRSTLAEFEQSTVFPLAGEGRFRELSEIIEARLEAERDPDVRCGLMSHLVNFLGLAGLDDESLHWAHEICVEFDESPFAWGGLAGWYLYRSYSGKVNRAELQTALGHCETGLQRARAKDEFIRYILFDKCRILARLEDYQQLEETMREIIRDLEIERKIDSPRIEAEWLKWVPSGKVDSALVARFKRLEEADVERTKPLWPEIRPATLDELES